MNQPQYKLGWRSDLEDRAWLNVYSSKLDYKWTYLAPEEIDPRPWMSIHNQGNMGSCSGHAGTTVLEYLNWVATQGQIVQLSRMFCYLKGQAQNGLLGRDQGATISGVVQAMRQDGICLETSFPYPQSYHTQIPSAAITEAQGHRVAKHSVLSNYEACFNWLASGVGGIEIGIAWTSSLANNSSGLIDSDSGQNYGGHALAVIGYTKRTDQRGRKYLLMFNSHGTGWGSNGVAEVAPSLFDKWGRDQYAELIGISDLNAFAPRTFDWIGKGVYG